MDKTIKDNEDNIPIQESTIEMSSTQHGSPSNMTEISSIERSIPRKKSAITTDKTYSMDDPCPCGSQYTLGMCCGRFFDGNQFPETPEELLRSRYTAHVTHHHTYLINTTHSDYRQAESEADITKWIDQLEWKGLTILTSTGGTKHDTNASIFFITRFLVNGFPREMKETAHFIKEDNKWFYTYGDVEGHITYKREQPKIGRNESCPCGSGKKYKKCCMNKQ